jgi:hypothetical protein
MDNQTKGTRDENEPRRQHTPSNNPQHEDLLTKQKEPAALTPREKKTANFGKALAGILQIHRWQVVLEARLMSANRPTMKSRDQVKAPRLRDFRPSCKSPKRAHNTAMILMIDSPGNHHS